ncbi:MAG: methyltransferase domain-containing protein [Lachnospiraceae bacterium]|nr:methyltransferase domain-containing protein [Lachnospiraceae bacterium]
MKCKLCNKQFDGFPVFKLENMPAGAQKFLRKEDIASDRSRELELYSCPYCNMVQLVSTPVDYYRDCIRASGVSEEMAKEKTSYYHQIFEEYNLIDKDVLEIGCGGGEFLKLIKDAGARALGLEHKEELVNKAIGLGYNVIKGYPGECEKEEMKGRFDGFICSNFLEHAPKPDEFLQGISDMLKENAVGVIEVPNFEMVQKKMLFTELIIDHLLYFTNDTLRQMLELNGFEVVSVKLSWHDYIITAIVRKRKAARFDGFLQTKEDLISKLRQFVMDVNADNRRLAVWGASHLALSVIAMSQIQDSIAYIVDSAEFKQGLYTPGTHLLVVPPKTLKEEPVDIVLVLATSYNREVVSILKHDYPEVDIMVLEGTRLITADELSAI